MSDLFSHPPVLGFAAYSGTGKTTLLTKILPLLRAHQLRIGMIKHAHHDFDIDTPGKDSYELRKAGAEQMLVASDQRWALMRDFSPQPTSTPAPGLEDLLRTLHRDELDVILVEGFRHVPFNKIELHRSATGKPLLYPQDPSIIAVASDTTLDTPLPQLDINSPQAVAGFILSWMKTRIS